LATALASAAALLALFLVWRSDAKTEIPTFTATRDRYRTSEAILLDRNGEILHELRADPDRRRLEWPRLEDVSPALTSAVIHAEDRDFRLHRGVAWTSFVSGMASTVIGGTTRGASTITMQLASLLDPMLKPGSGAHRSYKQKIIQVRRALRLEQNWKKDEILEAYLNLASFRGELQGITAASRALFGKEPHGLDSEEAAVLACLLRSPNAALQKVQERARLLLTDLGWGSSRDSSSLEEKITRSLGGSYSIRPAASLALHAATRLLQPANGGSRSVRSTIDKRLQSLAQEVLRGQLQNLRDENAEDGAVLVLDNRSGEVLAYVGNNGVRSSARYVDGTRALRQAGSILKPFLYALAFDRAVLTPVSLLDDSPLEFSVGGGSYRPRNYDEQFHGLVTTRTGLASSLNIPAVRTLQLVGVEDFWGILRRLGFRSLQESEFYGASLALGTADICLEDLVNAYRAMANGGVLTAARLTLDTPPTREVRIFSGEAAFLVSDILSDRESRALTFGLENPLATRFWTAVKTGTSKDMRDNWCVGYSDRYAVGVWIGNFSGASMWNVSGVSGAAPVWLEIMNHLHRGGAGGPRVPPKGLVRKRVEVADLGISREEWFLAGTEPLRIEAIEERAGARIVYPPTGSLLAVDPDIPRDSQMVLFEASSPKDSIRWVLNGKRLADEGKIVKWVPKPGKHRLVLQDAAEKQLDAVEFEVRGGE